jgi:hypothetical protein
MPALPGRAPSSFTPPNQVLNLFRGSNSDLITSPDEDTVFSPELRGFKVLNEIMDIV